MAPKAKSSSAPRKKRIITAPKRKRRLPSRTVQIAKRANVCVTRQYDGIDHRWVDKAGVVSPEDAEKSWGLRNGVEERQPRYEGIDYYKVFSGGSDVILKYED